jgi:antirestriction protein ArdC
MATRSRSTAPGKSEQKDFRQEFTDKVIAAIESGEPLPWERPWTAIGSPKNAVSGKEYNGMNRLHLANAMIAKGYSDPRFLTFKQAQDLGGSVRKGEKGVHIERWGQNEFWKRKDVTVSLNDSPVKVQDYAEGRVTLADGRQVSKSALTIEHEGKTYDWDRADRNLSVPYAKVYTVFNVQQCDGLKLEPLVPKKDLTPDQRFESIKRAMEAEGLKFSDGPKAVYLPRTDTVLLPPKDHFHSVGDYQSTALHEIGHATGAAHRLNRDGVTGGHAFGTDEYAREELRAELFSAFAAMETGINRTRDEQHMAYLKSWARVLAKDKNELFRAAADATKAVDYVLAKERELGIDAPSLEAAPAPGLTTIDRTALEPGLDVVEKDDKMSRILSVQHDAATGQTVTTAQDMDSGDTVQAVYKDGDKITVTTRSLEVVQAEKEALERVKLQVMARSELLRDDANELAKGCAIPVSRLLERDPGAVIATEHNGKPLWVQFRTETGLTVTDKPEGFTAGMRDTWQNLETAAREATKGNLSVHVDPASTPSVVVAAYRVAPSGVDTGMRTLIDVQTGAAATGRATDNLDPATNGTLDKARQRLELERTIERTREMLRENREVFRPDLPRPLPAATRADNTERAPLIQIEQARQVTGRFEAIGLSHNPDRMQIHMTRAGQRIRVEVPREAIAQIPAGHGRGDPLVLRQQGKSLSISSNEKSQGVGRELTR